MTAFIWIYRRLLDLFTPANGYDAAELDQAGRQGDA